MKAYRHKFVCCSCDAVHYYNPNKCQSCGCLYLTKEMNMSTIKDPADDLRLDIDRNRLDDEWANQPLLYWKWARKAADAQLKLDQAKSNLDVEKAELDNDIRTSPGEYDLKDIKITENVISGAINASRIYQIAVKKVAEARHELEIANAAVNAIEHRKRALSLLVELWIRDYYSDPHANASSEEGDAWQKRQVRTAGQRGRGEDDNGTTID